MYEPSVDGAVQKALDDITDMQVAAHMLKVAWNTLLKSKRHVSDELYHAYVLLHNEIHSELTKRWADLAYFGTVDLRAKKALHERAKSWFEDENHEIMSFVDMDGSYYVSDREKFVKSLKSAFGLFDDVETNE